MKVNRTLHVEQTEFQKLDMIETKYYTKELHKAAFVLPKFVRDLLKQGGN